MALMSKFGAGFVFKAIDRASPVFRKVGSKFGMMAKKVVGSSNVMSRGLAPLAAGYGIFRFGKGMTGAAKAMADAAGTFEQSLKGVGVITRATSEEFKLLHDTAIDAAAKTQFSPDQAVEGLTSLATAGLNARQATVALIPVLDLATGSLGQLGLAEAADAVVGTIKAFGMEASKATFVTDRLLRITQLTNFQARDFSVGLSRAASTAKIYKQSLDDTLITMGLLRNMNIDASVASTSLRESWRRLASDQRSQQFVLAKGVKIFSEGGKKIRPMLDIMSDLAEKTANLTDKERMRLLTMSFGVRGMAAFNAVAEAQQTIMIDGVEVTLRGAKAVRALRDEMAGAQGTAAKFKKELLDTYKGQKQLIGGMVQTIKVLIGEGGTRALKPVMEVIYGILDGVRGIVQAMPVSARATIISTLGAIGTFIAGIGGVMALVGALGMLGITLSGVLVGIAGLAIFLVPAIILFSGFAVAIVSFATAFKRNVGGIGTSWSDTVKKLKLGARAIADIFTKGTISGPVLKELEKIENQGVMRFVRGFEAGFERLKIFWKGLREGFVAGVEALAPSLKKLTDRFGGVFDLFETKNPSKSLDDWKTSGQAAGRTLASMGETAINALVKLIDFGSGVKDAILSITGDDISQGMADFKSWFEVAKDAVSGLVAVLKVLTFPIKFYRYWADWGGMMGQHAAIRAQAGEFGREETARAFSTLEFQGEKVFSRKGARQEAGLYGAEPGAGGAGMKRERLETVLKDWGAWMNREGKYSTREGLGGKKYLGELPAKEQANLLEQFKEMNKQLKALGGQPIVLKVDSREIAKATRAGGAALADEDFGL